MSISQLHITESIDRIHVLILTRSHSLVCFQSLCDRSVRLNMWQIVSSLCVHEFLDELRGFHQMFRMFMLSICGLICCHDHETYRYCLRARGQGTRGLERHSTNAVNWQTKQIFSFLEKRRNITNIESIEVNILNSPCRNEVDGNCNIRKVGRTILVRSEASKMGVAFNLIVVCAAWSLCGAYRSSLTRTIQSEQTGVCARKAVVTLG